jgi:hypothetical protein
LKGVPVAQKSRVAVDRFSFAWLPEGSYTFHSELTKDESGRSTVFAAQAFIEGTTPAKVTLLPIRTAIIKGSVILPAGWTSPTPPSLQIGADPRFDTATLGPSTAVQVEGGLTFKFSAWPGKNAIVVRVQTPSLYVKAIRLRGNDITDEAVDILDGQDIEDVEVELTDVSQTVTGSIAANSDANTVPQDTVVVVFPAERDARASRRRVAVGPEPFHLRSL